MSWPTERTLAAATAASLALHAVALALLARVPAPPVTGAPEPVTRVLRFELRERGAAGAPVPSAPLPFATAPAPPLPAPAVPDPPAAPAPPAPARADTVEAPSPFGGLGDELDTYLPRSQLSAPAAPVSPVNLQFPEELQGAIDLRVELTLYIDEGGRVRHIRIDTPGVHPAFERAIRRSFDPLAFEPGRRDGEAVRSRMRIEVEFSNARRFPSR